eukprot:UN00297
MYQHCRRAISDSRKATLADLNAEQGPNNSTYQNYDSGSLYNPTNNVGYKSWYDNTVHNLSRGYG